MACWKTSGAILILAVVAACSARETESANVQTPDLTKVPVASSATSEPVANPETDCPVIDSRNWHAWVDVRHEDGEKSYVLKVAGQVDLPKPGYTVSLKTGPTDRMMPPGQRLIMELVEPEGMVAQLITPTDVMYSDATSFPVFSRVIVGCGEKVIAEMVDVTPME